MVFEKTSSSSRPIPLGLKLTAALLVYVLIEGMAWAGLACLYHFKGIQYQPIRYEIRKNRVEAFLRREREQKNRYVIYDRALGWALAKNGHARKGFYRTNAEGIRGDRDYGEFAPAGRLRIAALGDSFTHGSEVSNEDTWTARLDALDEGIEVLNFGVMCYGLDQAWLRYKKQAAGFHPDIVLIGFVDRDMGRAITVYWPFYGVNVRWPLTKPRFALSGTGLEHINNPMQSLEDYDRLLEHPGRELRSIAERDSFAKRKPKAGVLDFLPSVRVAKTLRYVWRERREGIYRGPGYHPESEAFQVNIRLFDRFLEDVKKDGAVPVIVLMPAREELGRFVRRQVKVYQQLLDYFDQKGYRYLDLAEVMAAQARETSVKSLFLKQHYSPLGNEKVAEAVYAYLEEQGFVELTR